MSGVTFTVHGTPTPQGSTKAFVNKRTGHAQITYDNAATLGSWRQDIAARAQDAGVALIDGPVQVRATFGFLRPASVTAKKRPLPVVKPDIDKLVRALLDALTGLAYHDDAQVVSLDVVKVYAAAPGLRCHVAPACVADVAPERSPVAQLELDEVAAS